MDICYNYSILYHIHCFSEEDSKTFCRIHEIRPRARTVISINDLKVGQTVMINHNNEESHEKGYW